ncbi:alpha/beta fold hydrolase [Actinomycetospora chlora]|uniref:Alpha/beta fold hydrolase n=1 Tax=Actinomycetospora chlora TaxID=663608 RepID=A0ABP9AFH1_9PSEU
MLDETTSPRRDVWFDSGADRCHAWLYLPAGASSAAPVPVIVMAHGLGAVKALRLSAYADRFTAAGYACLVFDYRYFGDSGGEPRELLSITSQRQDWQAAVTFARTLPEVDPNEVVVWGTSFAGGHVVATAARDPRIAAAIAQAPFLDGIASVRQLPVRQTLALVAAGARDLLAQVRGREPVRIKAGARPGEIGLMSSTEDMQSLLALLAASGIDEADYPNDVPARVALTIPVARPGRAAGDVACPILFCVADRDNLAPPDATVRFASRAPRGEIRRYDTGHFDIYLGEDFDAAVTDQLAFLARHVPVAKDSQVR